MFIVLFRAAPLNWRCNCAHHSASYFSVVYDAYVIYVGGVTRSIPLTSHAKKCELIIRQLPRKSKNGSDLIMLTTMWHLWIIGTPFWSGYLSSSKSFHFRFITPSYELITTTWIFHIDKLLHLVYGSNLYLLPYLTAKAFRTTRKARIAQLWRDSQNTSLNRTHPAVYHTFHLRARVISCLFSAEYTCIQFTWVFGENRSNVCAQDYDRDFLIRQNWNNT